MIVSAFRIDGTMVRAAEIEVRCPDGARERFLWPFREKLTGRDAYLYAVRRLFPVDLFPDDIEALGSMERGWKFKVPDGEKLRELDKEVIRSAHLSFEQRRAAFKRHNRRQASVEITGVVS